jgi:hypothetical protein
MCRQRALHRAHTKVETKPDPNLLDLKRKELAIYQEMLRIKQELPHLHGLPWYTWAWDFFTTANREAYLCAGNQLSKSSTQIRKAIHWATSAKASTPWAEETGLWKELWPSSSTRPNVFWYLYPTKDVATEEFELKWKEFLPRGKMKEDEQYGWDEEYQNKKIYAIHFKSGISIYFKTYSQDATDLQTGTIFAIFCDEELPTHLLPELKARLNGTDGYFSMVFTATIGQDYWRRVIEGTGEDEELPHAWKKQVSLFECVVYKDGSPSPWTPEKIQRAIARCANQSEVLRRIYGKFVVIGGRKFESFSREKNVCKPHAIASNWLIYSAVDYGSGGPDNHPAAMLFLAVSPDFKMGRVFRARRMDKVLTTAADVLDEYILQRGKLTPILQTYDWASKDFHTFATRRNEPFLKANKDQDEGTGTVNTLFKAGMLKLFDDDPEIEKLIVELLNLKSTTAKRDAADDLCDTLRYAAMSVPWDWSVLDEVKYDEDGQIKEPVKAAEPTELDRRRDLSLGKQDRGEQSIEDELAEWDGLINEFDS